MKLLYFRSKISSGEFIILSDDNYVKQNIKEFAVDGFKLHFQGSVIPEEGAESGLPTDRELSPS